MAFSSLPTHSEAPSLSGKGGERAAVSVSCLGCLATTVLPNRRLLPRRVIASLNIVVIIHQKEEVSRKMNSVLHSGKGVSFGIIKFSFRKRRGEASTDGLWKVRRVDIRREASSNCSQKLKPSPQMAGVEGFSPSRVPYKNVLRIPNKRKGSSPQRKMCTFL